MITYDLGWSGNVANAYKIQEMNRKLYQGKLEEVLFAGKNLPFKIMKTNLLGECLTEPLADLIAPNAPKISADSPQETLACQESLQEVGWGDILWQSAIQLSWSGECVWKVVIKNGIPTVVLWGRNPGEFTTIHPSGSICSFWYDLEINKDDTVYRYKIQEQHNVSGDTTTVINRVWTGSVIPMIPVIQPDRPVELGLLSAATEVPWSQVEDIIGLPQQYDIPAMPMLPAYQITNPSGATDYTDSRVSIQTFLTLVESARILSVELTTVPQLLIPPDCVDPETGALDWKAMTMRIRRPGDDRDALSIDIKQAITSLGDSTKVLENIWEDWYAVSPISPIYYGKSVASDASGKSLETSLSGTVRAVEKRRRLFDRATNWLLLSSNAMRRAYLQKAYKYIRPNITIMWDPVIKEDDNERAERISTAVANGWMSIKQAIRESNPGIDEDMVEEQYQEILSERNDGVAPIPKTTGSS